MSIFCFREALAYLGLQLRATFQKEIDKQEAEIKKKKKLKEKLRKLSWSVAAVTRKQRAENYFIWGLSGEEFSKLNISSQSKAQCWFRKRKTEPKIIEKTKICIPAMLKPYSASSFCLPNKNRVGVARGDGTNLEVVYIVREVLSVRERDTEREIERDGSDVTIVARLAMNSHFHLPKIRDELTLSHAKNSHFSFLPSHFPSLPSRRGHHCGAEIRNEFTLSIAKHFFRPLCSPSFKWHEPRDEWSKTQDKWSNPAQSYFVLPIEKLNQINTKNYWK